METLDILNTKLNISKDTFKKYVDVIKKIESTSFIVDKNSSKEQMKIDMDLYYAGGYNNLRASVEWMLRDIVDNYMKSNLKNKKDWLTQERIFFGTTSKEDLNSLQLSLVSAAGGYINQNQSIVLRSDFIYSNLLNKNYLNLINLILHESTHHLQYIYDNKLMRYSDDVNKILKNRGELDDMVAIHIDENLYDKYIVVLEDIINPFLDEIYNNKNPLTLEGKTLEEKKNYIKMNLYYDSLNERNAREVAAIHTNYIFNNIVEFDESLNNNEANDQIERINKDAKAYECVSINGVVEQVSEKKIVKIKEQFQDLSAENFVQIYREVLKFTTGDSTQFEHRIRYSLMAMYLSKEGNEVKLIKYAKKNKELAILVDLAVLNQNETLFKKCYKRVYNDRLLNQFNNNDELKMLIKCDKERKILPFVESIANVVGNMNTLEKLKISGYELTNKKTCEELLGNCKRTVNELINMGYLDKALSLVCDNMSFINKCLIEVQEEEYDKYKEFSEILFDMCSNIYELQDVKINKK